MKYKGITIVIDGDTTGLSNAFKKVNADIKDTSAEMRDMEYSLKGINPFKEMSKATEILTEKQNLLNDKIKETKEHLRIAQEALSQLKERAQTDDVVKAQEQLQREIITDQARLQDLEEELKEFGSVGKQQAKLVGEAIRDIGSDIVDVGEQMSSVGRELTTKVSRPIVAAGTSMFNSAVDFESAMAKVKSVSLSATEEQMEQLTEAALELSGNSKYSATEAAEALYYMGLAGWDAAEMLRALPDVLNLAAAGDLDLGRASDIVTDYVTAFGLEAEDATHLVDVMAQTMTNSNTTVDQMGEAFKYVAPLAGAAGYSIEDVSLALGLMANNGIKGSQAGTSLRMLLQRMVHPTAETAEAMEKLGIHLENDEGEMLSFYEVMGQLREALNGVSVDKLSDGLSQLDAQFEDGIISEEEYNEAVEELIESLGDMAGAERLKYAAVLAGTRGMSGLVAITNTTIEDYDELTGVINNATGATQEIADIMMDTTEGSMTKMQHQIENIGIEFGNTMLPYMQKAIDKTKGAVTWFQNLNDEQRKTIVTIGAAVAAAGPALNVIGNITQGVGHLTEGVGALVAQFGVAGAIGSGIGVVALAGLTVAIGAAIAAGKEARAIAEDMYGLGDAERQVVESINENKTALEELQAERNNEIASTEAEIGKYENLLEQLGNIVDANGTIKEGYQARAEYIVGELSEALGIEIEINDGIIHQYADIRDSIDSIIEKKRQESIINAYEAEYEEALAKSSRAANDLFLAEDALKAGTQELADAQAELNDLIEKDRVWQEGGGNAEQYAGDIQAARLKVQALEGAQKELNDAVKDAAETYETYMVTIENYEGVLAAVASEDVGALEIAIQKLTSGFKTATTASSAELRSQYNTIKTEYEAMQKAVEGGAKNITQAQLDAMYQLEKDAAAELAKMTGDWDRYYREFPEVAANALESNIPTLVNKIDRMNALAKAQLEKAEDIAREHGKNFAAGFAKGIEDNYQKVTNASAGLVIRGSQGITYTADMHSPSKLTEKYGVFFGEGFANGIVDSAKGAILAARDMTQDSINALQTTMPTLQSAFLPGGRNNSESNMSYTYGDINVTVNGAEAQNDYQLAEMVAEAINRQVYQRKMVLA